MPFDSVKQKPENESEKELRETFNHYGEIEKRSFAPVPEEPGEASTPPTGGSNVTHSNDK